MTNTEAHTISKLAHQFRSLTISSPPLLLGSQDGTPPLKVSPHQLISALQTYFARNVNFREIVKHVDGVLQLGTFRLAAGDKHRCHTLSLRVTSRRPGAWKARGPDRRQSGGFGLSAKSDTKRIVSPYRGRQRADCLVSTGPAPLLAGELKVTGLKRANVGDSSLVSAFGKKRVIAKLISSASRPCGVVARYDNDPCVSVAMTISPVRDHQK